MGAGSSLPIELRERIVQAHVDRGLSQTQVAELFQVGRTTVRRYLQKVEAGESLEPGRPPGPTPKLTPKHFTWLKSCLQEDPYLTSYELAAKYNRRFKSNPVHRSTILRAMHKLGYTYKKRPS